ncbi:LLM class flavin-dependent oxidoreductase [Microbacterium sp. B2969]|uniref:LLM class flavin-dependent oxidoreductase n=1 Tax=Microbacterium alkaliflavum TaxID=3248839 RepID=A0ABW7QC94_9MICO
MSGVPLGVLELGKRAGGRVEDDARALVDVALRVEAAGYRRLWIAEHHVDDAAVTVPEVLLAAILTRTSTIRAGLGGVILPYRSPYRVAELARSLAVLAPGRVDLGVCRGPGLTDPAIADALVQGSGWELAPAAFDRKVRTTLRLFRGEGAPHVWPDGAETFSPWVLGSSDATAALAGEAGAGFAASLFILRNEEVVARSVAAYRAAADPASARVVVAVSVVAGASAEEAHDRHEALQADGFLPSNIVGEVDECRRRLAELAARLDADEILIVSFSRDPEARATLYEALGPEV